MIGQQTKPPRAITISCQIVAQTSKTPLEYATVSFLAIKNKEVIGTGIADVSGNVSVTIPYRVHSTSRGYYSPICTL